MNKFQEIRVWKNSITLRIVHEAYNCFIISYNNFTFNTLFDYLDYIYGWNNNEKILYYSFIYSLK